MHIGMAGDAIIDVSELSFGKKTSIQSNEYVVPRPSKVDMYHHELCPRNGT